MCHFSPIFFTFPTHFFTHFTFFLDSFLTHFHLGLAFRYRDNFALAFEQFRSAAETVKRRLAAVSSLPDAAAVAETAELKGLLEEFADRISEVVTMLKQQQTQGTTQIGFGNNSTSTSSSTSATSAGNVATSSSTTTATTTTTSAAASTTTSGFAAPSTFAAPTTAKPTNDLTMLVRKRGKEPAAAKVDGEEEAKRQKTQ